MDNKDYIIGLLQHDTKTLNAIYDNYAHRIQHHVISKGGTIDDAKDIFQDGLMIIYNKAKNHDFELTSQFYTYLFGTCRFLWDRKSKKKSNNTVTIETDDRYINDSDIEKDIIEREKHNLYKEKFVKLGSFCQKLLQLFYAKKSMMEITDLLKLKNEHTARNRKYRCQKKLEELIKADTRFKELQK